MKTIKVHIDGMVTGSMIKHAEKKLKKYDTAQCYVTAMNGQDLYIKENGVIRDSTTKEWKAFHKQQG